MMSPDPAVMRVWGNAATLAAPVMLGLALFMGSLPGGAGIASLDRWAISVLSVALLTLGFSLRRGKAAFGALAFVFLTGAGAQLYLTEPLWFPTLRLKPTGIRDGIMIVVLAFEVFVTVSILRNVSLGALMTAAARRLGTGRVVLTLGLTCLFAVPLLNYVGRGAAVAYIAHLAAGTILLLLHMAVLLAMSQVPSPVSGIHRISPVAYAAIAVAASFTLGIFAFESMPHVEDEVAYIFQARTLAGGALTAPAPPEAVQVGLEYYLIEMRDGRWYSTTLPGWPVALSAAIAIGVPCLLNPFLAGASVLLAFTITRRMVGRDTADIVALLMASSPWLMAAAGSLMPHALTLALSLFGWWLILRTEAGAARPGLWLLIAGLAMGWIFCSRPLDGIIIGGLTGLWVLFGPKGSLQRALPYALGCVLGGGILLIFNWKLTGSPLILPLGAYLDRHWLPGANAYGFGPDIGPPGGWGMLDLWPGHSPGEAVINTVNLFASLQLELMGWPIGSLLLLFGFFFWQKNRSTFDKAMAGLLVVVILAMALYWFAETYYFGPRYWFLAAFPIFYLSARGYVAIRDRLPGSDSGIRFETMLWLLCAFGLLVFTPWRGVAKYYEYNNFYDEFSVAAATGTFGSDVILMTEAGDEGSAFFLNDPWLRADRPMFLLDTGQLDEAAIEVAFPGRKIRRYSPAWTPGNPAGR
jgi:hypothetical protein